MSEVMEQEINNTMSDTEVFRKLLVSPREVFKYINDNHYDKYTTILLALGGISRAFDRASMRGMGDHSSLAMIVGMCIIVGGLFGWLSFYMYAGLLNWTGKWLNANGNTQSILRVLAYAMVPAVIALIYLIPQIGIYGIEVFKSDGDLTSAGVLSNIAVWGSMFFELVLGVWSIVLCVIGISEVQKLPIGKSILNLLLPVIVIVTPIILVVLLTQL